MIMEPAFSLDWSDHLAAWPEHLAELRGAGGRALEVGSFEGQTSLWLADWLGPDGHVVCVDPFTGDGNVFYDGIDMSEVGRRFFENTCRVRGEGRLTAIVGYSRLVLPMLPACSFDVVYIDGDHRRSAVRDDAAHATRLVRRGGHVIFDDYDFPDHYPGVRAEADVLAADDRFDVVHRGYQLHLRRVA